LQRFIPLAKNDNKMKKKTYKAWEKSGLDLENYLTEPCEIDEELYNYLGEIVPPQYCYDGLLQSGEADHSDDDGVMYFLSASIVNEKYYYLGVLPEFIQ
jgi:hypothetical protein